MSELAKEQSNVEGSAGKGLTPAEVEQYKVLRSKLEGQEAGLSTSLPVSEKLELKDSVPNSKIFPEEVRNGQIIDPSILNPDQSQEAKALRTRIEKINDLLSGNGTFTFDQANETNRLALGLDEEEK